MRTDVGSPARGYRSHPSANGNRAAQNRSSRGSASTRRTTGVMPGASRGPGGGFVSQGAGSGVSLTEDDARAIAEQIEGRWPWLRRCAAAPS